MRRALAATRSFPRHAHAAPPPLLTADPAPRTSFPLTFTSMAPTPPTSTWPHRHHTLFLRPLALVLAIVRPASSEFMPSLLDASSSSAYSPPPPSMDGGGGGGRFTQTIWFVLVCPAGLIAALWVLGFFSAILRRCSGADDTHGRGGALAANAADAAAAFSSAAANDGRSRAAGLDAAAMEALPVLTYATARAVKAGRGALECAVCLSAFDDGGEKLRLLPGCCHVFHAACIDAWLAAHVTCPVCRADLSDPAVADAGNVLAADLAAAAQAGTPTNTAVVNMDGSTPAAGAGAGQDTTSMSSDEQQAETAEERVDRFTLRLPERLRREIDEAKRLRRALSAVTAPSGGPLASSAALPLRTMSAARPSRRWSGLFRALSGSRRASEPDGHRRVVPLPTGDDDGEVEVVVVRDDVDKYYAHSLTFAGFVIDGDVAAGDWNPEVFHVSTGVPAVVATSQR